jgi:regulation of enolase protein 1 (concanavalin A-like superfamily)
MRRMRDGDDMAALWASFSTTPSPLAWEPEPVEWRADQGSLAVETGPETDLFVNPGDGRETLNAPRLLGRVEGDFMLSARVSVAFRSTFDAGVLLLWSSARSWAKLCFELSPQGEPMVVSVVTRGASDDCNSFVVDDGDVRLRIARLGSAYAFHASTDGAVWRLVRHFALEPDVEPRVGFLAQSPLGAGCSVRFDQISFTPDRLDDLRSGV